MYARSGYVEKSGSGTIAALNGAVTINVPAATQAILSITGTWSATLTFEGSVDGTTYSTILASKLSSGAVSGATTTTSNGLYALSTGGWQNVRVRASSYTSGTVAISWNADSNVNIGISPAPIRGATDGSTIGNTGNRLNVDTIITPSPGSVPSVSSKLRYNDMNATTGGVARETLIAGTFTQIYSYTGSGLLLGMVLNLENKDKWYIRLMVDGEEVFGSAGLFTLDMVDDKVYDLDDGGSPLSTSEGRLGISMEEHARFVWTPPSGFPIRYTSSIKVYVRRSDGASKKLYAGLAILTKET